MRPVVRFQAAVDGYIAEADGSRAGFPMDGGISPPWTRTSLPPHDGEPARRCDLVRDSLVDAVASLKRETGKGIWLRGGAQLASTLFAAGLVDEIVRKLNPVLFGSEFLWRGGVSRR